MPCESLTRDGKLSMKQQQTATVLTQHIKIKEKAFVFHALKIAHNLLTSVERHKKPLSEN